MNDLDRQTLQLLVELLPPGRARRKYEHRLTALINPGHDLVLKEAELVLLKAQVIGDPQVDYWAIEKIESLESQIASIKQWLAESEELQK